MFVVAFTFVLQCYIAQTHVHSVPHSFDSAVKISTKQSPAPAKAPIDHSPMECPLCQAVMHAGAAVLSATPALNLPFAWVNTVKLISTMRPSSDLTAHEWQSRAPPRL